MKVGPPDKPAMNGTEKSGGATVAIRGAENDRGAGVRIQSKASSGLIPRPAPRTQTERSRR